MFKQIPNILTSLRILLVPVFVWQFYFPTSPQSIKWAMAIFIIAEITDYFDGSIARKYNLVSNFGKIMDPLADKLLTGAALIGIALPPQSMISYIAVFIILLREISVSILRQHYVRKKIFIPANQWGKFKTVIQMAGLSAAMIYLAFSSRENIVITMFFYYYFWLAALVTAFSGMSYFWPLFGFNSKEEK